MAETTKIQWTHCTFNPWIGCSVEVAERGLTSVYSDQNGMSEAIAKSVADQLKANEMVNFIGFRITGIVLDPQVQAAVERKQIAQQDLERKETEVAIAKKEAERLSILKTQINDLTIRQDFVNKWDGKTPINADLFVDASKK